MTTVTVTFDVIPDENETLIVTFDTGGGNQLVCNETFRELRYGYATCKIADFFTTEQAAEYKIAWDSDYKDLGGIDNLSCVTSINSVIISVADASWQVVSVTGTAVDNSKVSYVINNDVVEDPKSVVRSGWTAFTPGRCDSIYADIDVTGGDGSYDVYLDDVLVQSAQTTPLSVLVTRNDPHSIRVIDSTGTEIDTIYINPPRSIIEDDIKISIINLLNDSTATINVTTHVDNEDLEYSIQPSPFVWGSSNVFTGLAPDTYTINVKDVFGCITSKSFIVDGVTVVTETVFSISDINPLRFSVVDSLKPSHRNRLSCEENRQIKIPFLHKFLQTDLITIQFKTNAAYIDMYSIDRDRNQINIPAIKKTANIGLEKKTTSTYFSLGSGRSAIYFGVVDVLNVLTDAVEDTVDFGFTLPEWADTEGHYVEIEGIGYVPIDSIGYSEFYDSFILEFNIAYTGSPVTKKLYSRYNLQPYEVYEAPFLMSSHPSLFQVVLNVGEDANNIKHTVISEKVSRVTDHDGLFKIEYSDSKNKGGMVYQTEVVHTIRLEGIVDYEGEQETEGYDGDTDYFVTKNTVYDSQKFFFFRLPGEMCAKLRLVFAHDILKVNDLSYKLSEVPSISASNPNNNQKTFSVTLKRSGDQFLTEEQEILSNTAEEASIAAAIEASQGKSLLLWTKTNG